MIELSTAGTVTQTKRQQRLSDPTYIRLCANDLVRYKWVEETLEFTGDEWFPTKKKVNVPFGRMSMTQHDDFDLVAAAPPDKYVEPNKYGRTFDDFVETYRKGRHWEKAVLYYLLQAGVVASLEDGVLDGDTDKKTADLLVRAAQPNEDGTWQWYSIEVKTGSGRNGFEEDVETWPDITIVDNVSSWDKKVKTALKNDTPLIGVLKIDVLTDTIFFIPSSSSSNWSKEMQQNYKQDTLVYKAPVECFRTFEVLVNKLGGTL